MSNEATFNVKHVARTHFGENFYKTTVDRADPIVYPRYTKLPNVPNFSFPMFPKSLLITIDPAGKMPLSTLMKRFTMN
jgi:hypothetical protein